MTSGSRPPSSMQHDPADALACQGHYRDLVTSNELLLAMCGTNATKVQQLQTESAVDGGSGADT